MKNFQVHIYYNDHCANFTVMAEDTKESVEKSILDKLGKNEVKFEKDGFRDSSRRQWITYEEVIDDRRPVHYEEVLGVKLGAGV